MSIPQPHVRPIMRGKAGKRLDLGAGLVVFGSYLPHQTIGWDAYNEGGDRSGRDLPVADCHFQVLIQCDKIYHTNANRSWCSMLGSRMTLLQGPKPNLSSLPEKKTTG